MSRTTHGADAAACPVQWQLARRRLLGAALASLVASPASVVASTADRVASPADPVAPPAEPHATPAGADPQANALRARRSREWFTDTVLVDQDGQPQRFFSDLLAPAQPRVALLHSVFTTCASACPLIVQKLSQLEAAMSPERSRELWVLSVSIDPLNDTPERLKAFAAKHGVDRAQWRFLTGAPKDVEHVSRRLGLWAAEPDAHQTTLIAGRASAAHWVKLRPDSPVPDLVQQLQRFWPRAG